MISNHNHSPNPYTDLIEHTSILGAAPCLSWHPSFRASEQRSNDFSTYQINHGQKMSKNVKHQLVAVTMSRHRYILCQCATNRKLPGNPPAYRRVLWVLLVRSATVCFVFV